MTGPIIDPRIFYWANTFNGLSIALMVLGSFLIAGAVIAIIFWLYNNYQEIDYGRVDHPAAKCHKKYKDMSTKVFFWCLIPGILLLTIGIFIPNKTTCAEMLAAKVVTWENTEWTIDQIKSVIDYVVQAMKGL